MLISGDFIIFLFYDYFFVLKFKVRHRVLVILQVLPDVYKKKERKENSCETLLLAASLL